MALRFRPRAWSIVGTLLLGALFVAAGTWQMHRGRDKVALERALQAAPGGPAVAVTTDTPAPASLPLLRGEAHGRYENARQLLLDNQSSHEVPGYHVWTPLLLATGGLLLVDRGWVKADPNRSKLPDVSVPEGERTVGGDWRPYPVPGLRLGHDDCSKQFPRVVSFPTRDEVSCILGGPVAAGVLELDPAAPDGYERDWHAASAIPPARHFAYAAQWYLFAATLLFFFVRLNLRRLP